MERQPEQNSSSILNQRTSRRQFLKYLLGLPVGIQIANGSCSIGIINQGQTTSTIDQPVSQLESSPEPDAPPPYQRKVLPGLIKGVSLPSWRTGEYQLPSTLKSIENISTLHPNMVGITPFQYQENIYSTDIYPTDMTPSDEDLIFIINHLHRQGYQVMLKPQVDMIDKGKERYWHGQIGKFHNLSEARQWHRSYREMINHYADLAQQTNTELFIVGNEYYISTLSRPDEWDEIIQRVKQRYNGPITYASHPYDFDGVRFWDQLDFLALNPYFPLTERDYPSLSELKSSWNSLVENRIEPWVNKWDKDLLFPEIGYPSVFRAGKRPFDYDVIQDSTTPVDVSQQANCIQAVYDTFANKPWWKGVIWWKWETDPNLGGLKNKEYTPWRKPAADIITRFNKRTSN